MARTFGAPVSWATLRRRLRGLLALSRIRRKNLRSNLPGATSTRSLAAIRTATSASMSVIGGVMSLRAVVTDNFKQLSLTI
eukprot:12788817-Heterocapsa_arctica.AAC.1